MKLSRRIMLIIASAVLTMGLLSPPASAGKPSSSGKQPPSADLGMGIRDNLGDSAATYDKHEITFEVGFGNSGPSPSSAALDLTVSGGSITSWSSDGRECSGSDSELRCDLGSLAVGEGSWIYVTVRPLPESLATGVTAEGSIYGPLPDPKPWTNSDSRHSRVQAVDVPEVDRCDYVDVLCNWWQ